MSGFTANLSNLPPGVSHTDIDRHFGERTHHERCAAHEESGWRPDIEDIYEAAVNLIESQGSFHVGGSSYVAVSPQTFNRLLTVVNSEPPCSCDEEAQADAEDAAERAAQENEGR